MINNNKRELNNNTKNSKNLGKVIFLIVISVFVLIILRFFYIGAFHHIDGVNLKKQVEQLYAKRTEIKAKRGTIYDANNQVIAEDTTNYSIYVVLSKQARTFTGKPAYLKASEKDKAAKILSDNLGIPYKKVKSMLSPKNPDLYQVELGSAGRGLSLETKKNIQKYHITGIDFTPSQARLYPNGIFASNFIGLAENKNNKLSGMMGMEKYYNKYLSGVDGIRSEQTDGQGTKLPWTKSINRHVENGDNIYTTIDGYLQNYLETLMTKAEKNYHPKNINAILMNAKTGAIIAASQRPTFNPQTRIGLGDSWRNTLTEDEYEPGSCMKIFSMAAAINSGHYNPKATYMSGTYNIDGAYVYDWVPTGWGRITYRQAFIRSSNVGMAHLEQQMGPNTWMNYIKSFGFLRSTNAPGCGDESSGSILYRYPIDQADTAYGQGIDVTVMQMMQGITAITNNGTMIQPRLINKIVNPNNGKTVYQTKTTVVGHPITASTAALVRSMMGDVITDPNGTGHAYKIPGYNIGVKTGTAQIAKRNGGGYLTGNTNYIFSVAGIAPLNNPKYILYVTIQQPKTFGAAKFPSKMVATIFNPMMEETLNYDKQSNAPTSNIVPNVKGLSVGSAKNELSKIGANVVICGNGTQIINQSILAGQRIMKNSKVILLTNGAMTLPNMSGWSRNDVLHLTNMLDIKANFKGSGFVKSQSVHPNNVVKKKQQINITLNSN